jgi:hypothetical protein
MDAYLESYERLLTELDTTSKNLALLKFSETSDKFVLERRGVKIIDIDRPVYGIVHDIINNEEKKLHEMRKQYRSLVYAYLYDMDPEPTLEIIRKELNAIEEAKEKLSALHAEKKQGKTYVILKEPRVNKLNTADIKPMNKASTDANLEANVVVVEDEVSVPVKKSEVKIGKTAKDILKQSLLTGEVSETDLKIFFFKTLKDCVARPSSKNNALSKDKLIEKMLENPNLKKRLPTSYRSKSKEEICKLLFPI